MPLNSIFQYKLWFEKSAVRLINPCYLTDMERVGIIDANPNVLTWMEGEIMSRDELLKFVKHETNRLIYAVSGSTNKDKSEIGKLQGWIQFYNHNRIPYLIKQCNLDSNCIYFDVSFAKIPSAETGQVSSSLRQLCFLFIMKNLINRDRRNIQLVAFCDIDNLSSQRVLAASGFESLGNKIKWDEKQKSARDQCFVLNPNTLQEILIKKQQNILKMILKPTSFPYKRIIENDKIMVTETIDCLEKTAFYPSFISS